MKPTSWPGTKPQSPLCSPNIKERFSVEFRPQPDTAAQIVSLIALPTGIIARFTVLYVCTGADCEQGTKLGAELVVLLGVLSVIWLTYGTINMHDMVLDKGMRKWMTVRVAERTALVTFLIGVLLTVWSWKHAAVWWFPFGCAALLVVKARYLRAETRIHPAHALTGPPNVV